MNIYRNLGGTYMAVEQLYGVSVQEVMDCLGGMRLLIQSACMFYLYVYNAEMSLSKSCEDGGVFMSCCC